MNSSHCPFVFLHLYSSIVLNIFGIVFISASKFALCLSSSEISPLSHSAVLCSFLASMFIAIFAFFAGSVISANFSSAGSISSTLNTSHSALNISLIRLCFSSIFCIITESTLFSISGVTIATILRKFHCLHALPVFCVVTVGFRHRSVSYIITVLCCRSIPSLILSHQISTSNSPELNLFAVSTIFFLYLASPLMIPIFSIGIHVLNAIPSLVSSWKGTHCGINKIAPSVLPSFLFSISISAKKSIFGEFLMKSAAVGIAHALFVKYGDTTFALASCCQPITSHFSTFSSILFSISICTLFWSSDIWSLTVIFFSTGLTISGLSHL